ncbi:hypothetical protein OG897_01795 [Streptomyces sp. NBC_00237]|uniref:hypothetical protein n=1 Tax=Streptomyces sp. NBC_00237 TaxID=2975687 RepID=UPI00225A9646|nr:hypothetical protein [Streptomyces sp. NBC_00237]MCX5200199.1 hypothetical protein [Streptomyces sp. NBC_00237]
MPFEADLADALDRSTDNLDPDLDHLVGGAVKRGRSRRNRRNLGAGVGACAVIAVAGLVMPGVLDRARHGGEGEGMEAVAFAAPRSAITGAQMIQAVEKSFPGGTYAKKEGQSNNPSDPSGGYVANGGFTFDDGRGLANVGVSAMRLKLPLQDGEGLSCEAEQTPPRAEGDTCELKELPSSATLPGGALLMQEKIADKHADGREPAHRWTTTLTVKSTGAQVQLVQWNTGGDFNTGIPKPTRPAPPLSPQQAAAVLTGSVWSPILGAVA